MELKVFRPESDKFGNSAKADCPKEFLGRTVYLAIV